MWSICFRFPIIHFVPLVSAANFKDASLSKRRTGRERKKEEGQCRRRDWVRTIIIIIDTIQLRVVESPKKKETHSHRNKLCSKFFPIYIHLTLGTVLLFAIQFVRTNIATNTIFNIFFCLALSRSLSVFLRLHKTLCMNVNEHTQFD